MIKFIYLSLCYALCTMSWYITEKKEKEREREREREWSTKHIKLMVVIVLRYINVLQYCIQLSFRLAFHTRNIQIIYLNVNKITIVTTAIEHLNFKHFFPLFQFFFLSLARNKFLISIDVSENDLQIWNNPLGKLRVDMLTRKSRICFESSGQ